MHEFISLFAIAVIALIAPLIAHIIPRHVIPEVVLLVAAGMVAGPHVLGFIEMTESMHLLSELGLAFLFLLAGYEVDIQEIKGTRGRTALGAWIATIVLAFAAVRVMPFTDIDSVEGVAIAISLSATAIGTLIPILKERGLMKTQVGYAVIAHGTIGEIGPILAMALLLSVRSTIETIVVLVLFIAVSVFIALVPMQARRFGQRFLHLIHMKAETTAQTTMRLTVVVLVGLVALASIVELDVVLGAFAAGFILRTALPSGREELEEKLDGLAYGFMIPLFFVTSGAGIDPSAVMAHPLGLIGVVALLLGVRAIPVYVSTLISPLRKQCTTRELMTIALYSTTSLPIIVAVTHVATSAQAMAHETASILVAAGALSVLLMPLLAAITGAAIEAHPIEFALTHLRSRHRVSRPTQISKSRAKKVRSSQARKESPKSDSASAGPKPEQTRRPPKTSNVQKASNAGLGTSKIRKNTRPKDGR